MVGRKLEGMKLEAQAYTTNLIRRQMITLLLIRFSLIYSNIV